MLLNFTKEKSNIHNIMQKEVGHSSESFLQTVINDIKSFLNLPLKQRDRAMGKFGVICIVRPYMAVDCQENKTAKDLAAFLNMPIAMRIYLNNSHFTKQAITLPRNGQLIKRDLTMAEKLTEFIWKETNKIMDLENIGFAAGKLSSQQLWPESNLSLVKVTA
jgi:hypothetical protein